MSNAAAIIVAAGKGQRMGASKNKVYLELKGRPLLSYTLEAFLQCPSIQQLIVVVADGEDVICQQEVINNLEHQATVELCIGGATRQDSVFQGLQKASSSHPIVLIHDGARPLVSLALIQQVIDAAESFGAAIPGTPVVDSLKQVDEQHRIVGAPSRKNLYQVQTPQGFHYDLIHKALSLATKESQHFTDDAGAVAHYSDVTPKLIPGEATNIKVTTPFDLSLAEWLVAQS